MFGHFEQAKHKRTTWLPLPILGQEQAMVDGKAKSRLVLRSGLVLPLKFRRKANQPEAYLELVVKDTSGSITHRERSKITRIASEQWQELNLEYKAQGNETAEVSLVNESHEAAYFDNLTLSQEPPIIVQENHYDPWGLNLVGIEKQGNPDHKFQYNGKEKQSELGLNWADYGARMYDPQLGRWHAVDPMTETQEAWTPYHYVYNNPVLRTDPDGRCPDGNCPEITVAGMIANTVKDLAVSAANVTFMAVEAMHPMRVYSQGGSQRASRDENGTIQLGIRPLPTSTGEVLRNAGSDALDAVNVASTAVGGGAGGAGLLLAKTVGKTAVTNAVVQAAKTSSDAPIKVTEEVIAKALEGSSMKTLQKEVSLPAVQRYVDKLQGGSTAPPIKVADGVIVDGNHRYVAGRVYGTEPAQVPYMISPSQAERIMPIQQIIVSPLDWGNH